MSKIVGKTFPVKQDVKETKRDVKTPVQEETKAKTTDKKN